MNDETRPSLREEMDELKSTLLSTKILCEILVERLNSLEHTVENLINDNEYFSEKEATSK
jgi:hypothetical protein